MILQPRKYEFKSRQKKRKKKKYLTTSLSFGTAGCQLSRSIKLTGKQIFRINLFLKRSARKSEKTKRAFWLNLFPHLPLTKKVKGSRMGKGAGKLSMWFTQLPAGLFLMEFRNLRPGRIKHFSKQLEVRLASQTKCYYTATKQFSWGPGMRVKLFTQPFSTSN